MATPNDHIDMMNRMPATAFPTHVNWPHISMRLIPPSPIVLSSGVKCRTLRGYGLLQRELNGDGHDDRYGHAVEQRRRELPLAYGIECRIVEQRDGPQDLRVGDLPARPDRGLDDDVSLHPRRLGNRRIRRPDVFRLHRGLDVPADAHRRGGRWRWRRSFRQATDHAPRHAAGDAAFDAAGHTHVEPGVDARLLADLFRGLDRGGVGVGLDDRLRRLRSRGRRRGRWWRWRR